MTNANSPITIPQSFAFNAPDLSRLGPQQDLRTGGALPATHPDAPPAPEFTVKQLKPGLWYWRAKILDGSMGIHQRGDFDKRHAARQFSTLESRSRNKEMLPFITDSQSLDPGVSGFSLLSSSNAFGRLVIAPSNDTGANYTPLFKETSVTDPTLVQITYSKGSTHRIHGLANLVVNSGGSAVPVLAILKRGQPPELLSDIVTGGPTSVGSMHTDLSGAFAATMTTLPTTAILFAVDNKIKSLTNTDAYTVQPQTTGYLPVGGGGFNMGLQSLNGSEITWLINALAPDAAGSQPSPNGTAIGVPGTYQGAVYRISLAGDEVDQIRLPMKWITQSGLIRDGFWFSDDYRIGFSNGRPLDTRVFRDPNKQAGYTSYVVGCHVVNNSDLYADILYDGSFPQLYRWHYNWNDDEWTNVAQLRLLTGSKGGICQATGNLPTSDTTGYLHQLNYGSSARTWFRQWQPPAGVDPYTYNNVKTFETGGNSYLPYLTIPGIEGKPMTWHRLYYGGQMDEGQVILQVGGTSVTDTTIAQQETFTGPLNMASRWRRRQFNRNRFRELYVQAGVLQGATTTKTPQVLPYIIEGLAYDDQQTFDQWSQRGQVTWS